MAANAPMRAPPGNTPAPTQRTPSALQSPALAAKRPRTGEDAPSLATPVRATPPSSATSAAAAAAMAAAAAVAASAAGGLGTWTSVASPLAAAGSRPRAMFGSLPGYVASLAHGGVLPVALRQSPLPQRAQQPPPAKQDTPVRTQPQHRQQSSPAVVIRKQPTTTAAVVAATAAAAPLAPPAPTAPAQQAPQPTGQWPPQQASWFRMDSVHEIEKRALPEFFTQGSSKTPQMYREYRDYMVVMGQQTPPSQYLSYTQCRRHLAGDASAILRVHMFLEHWGLINARAQQSVTDVAPIDIPMPSQPSLLVSTKLPTDTAAAVPAPIALETHPCIFPITSTSVAPSAKGPEAGDDEKTEPWTDQETALLLDAVERFPQDWDAIEKHVASKSKQQCIEHFLRLPIEDAFLEDHISLANSKAASYSSSIRRASDGDDDAVAMLVSFLAASVPPSIAQAAAKAAKEAGATDGVQAAAAAGLGVAAMRAEAAAKEEEHALQSLVSQAVEVELRKVDAKLAQLASYERFLDDEWGALDRARRRLLSDGIASASARLASSAPTTASSVPISSTAPPIQSIQPPT